MHVTNEDHSHCGCCHDHVQEHEQMHEHEHNEHAQREQFMDEDTADLAEMFSLTNKHPRTAGGIV